MTKFIKELDQRIKVMDAFYRSYDASANNDLNVRLFMHNTIKSLTLLCDFINTQTSDKEQKDFVDKCEFEKTYDALVKERDEWKQECNERRKHMDDMYKYIDQLKEKLARYE